MPDAPVLDPLTAFANFGDLLKYLRRRARLSQRDLSIALGYSESQVSRLESNLRTPDPPTLAALFVPALRLEDEPQAQARLLELAALARADAAPDEISPGPGGQGRPQAAVRLDDGAAPTLLSNLPVQLTSFIGREKEVAALKRLFSAGRPNSARLVTLTGPGGTGKTRLSLEVASAILADFPDGVSWVELAPIAEPALVPQAVADALGVGAQRIGPRQAAAAPRDETGQRLYQALAEHLRDKRLLLLLDNCEHLVGACAQLAERLLHGALGLRILATSREPLAIAGESTYPVPSLSLPEASAQSALETLSASEAVQLFVERAVAVRPDFALTAENALPVAQICRRLDGIPLAIELAAVRVRALSVDQIAARLDDRFGLLAGGSRTAPPRHQTLRGAIDWSYDLLSESERELLRHLSVFAGGWTLEAAEQVASVEGTLIDLLTQLVGKSLVLSEQRPGRETRFWMLETIRQYAQEKLAQTGQAAAARGRHLAFYLALAEQGERGLLGRDQLKWVKLLDQEIDNLRAALAWAIESQAADSALRLAGALSDYWFDRGYQSEGSRWLKAALNLPASRGSLLRSAWRARALRVGGWLADPTQMAEAQAWLEESLGIYRELGDRVGMAYALIYLGSMRPVPQEFPAALELFQQALDLSMSVEDGRGIGICLFFIGWSYDFFGEHVKAKDHYQRSVAVFRDEGDRVTLMHPLTALARLYWLDGEAHRARALLLENLAAFEEYGGKLGIWQALRHLFEISLAQGDFAQAREEALALQNINRMPRDIAATHTRLGQVDYMEGRLAEAGAHFEAALKMFKELKDENGMGWVPPWLGCLALRAGDLERARALVEEGLAVDDPNGYWPELAFGLLSRGDVARAQGQAAVAAENYARGLGIVLLHADRPDVAPYLEAYAKLAVAARQSHRAARLLGAAEALRDEIGTPVPPVERADYDRAVALARDQLDPAAFSAAWADGWALDWERAAAYALET